MLVKSFITLLLVCVFQLVNAKADVEETDPVITDILYIETNLGKIEIGLFGEIVPKTTENFVKLAPTYEETKTKFHRVIPDFVIQTGDFDGKGGHSAFGERGSFDKSYGPGYSGLEDENFTLKHDKIGRVSVANAGANTGGSQFFICLKPQPHLDGKHVVFGQVISGFDTVESIAKTKTQNDVPVDDILIKRAFAGKPEVSDVEEDDSDFSSFPAEEELPSDNKKNKEHEPASEGDKKEKEPLSKGDEQEPANDGGKEEQKPANEDDKKKHGEMKGASSIAFLPLIIMFVLVLILLLKNKNRFLHLIRGPRYRRVISVNGDNN